jgi:hypothetical protein
MIRPYYCTGAGGKKSKVLFARPENRGESLAFGDTDRGKLRAVKAMQHYRIATAVHDRDGDMPVVLQGLCLSRRHHLLGLIERDRRAIVTYTFMNGHIVLRPPARYSLRARDVRA